MCRQRNCRKNGILWNSCELVVLLVSRDAHQLSRSVNTSHKRGGNFCSHPSLGCLHCWCVHWTVLDNWHLLNDLFGGRFFGSLSSVYPLIAFCNKSNKDCGLIIFNLSWPSSWVEETVQKHNSFSWSDLGISRIDYQSLQTKYLWWRRIYWYSRQSDEGHELKIEWSSNVYISYLWYPTMKGIYLVCEVGIWQH